MNAKSVFLGLGLLVLMSLNVVRTENKSTIRVLSEGEGMRLCGGQIGWTSRPFHFCDREPDCIERECGSSVALCEKNEIVQNPNTSTVDCFYLLDFVSCHTAVQNEQCSTITGKCVVFQVGEDPQTGSPINICAVQQQNIPVVVPERCVTVEDPFFE